MVRYGSSNKRRTKMADTSKTTNTSISFPSFGWISSSVQ
uniref:Uncharacterized protein n=1 Tax=Strigamia maritima TaxID=126957 RepID=T1JNJ1_STRMM